MKKALLIIFTLFSFSTYAQDIIMENGTVTGCSGTFFDSGGAGGTYSSNETLVLTICPDNPGDVVRIEPDGSRTSGHLDGRTFVPAS